jgi:homocitrate synthase NifV
MDKCKQRPVKIIDTTLREGEQSPGVFFDLRGKKAIIDGLVELGVDEIELGIANREDADLSLLATYMRESHPRQSFSLWCRCLPSDIAYGASLNPTCLALSIPASDLHLEKKFGKDRQWAVRLLRHSISQALAAGVSLVAVGLEDASRADPEFILELALAAEDAGAFRLRLADTVGISTPATITQMLSGLKGGNLELGVHCHNDFGMATANTITAFEQGAAWGDVTLLGLGERAGNSRLEEVLAYLVLRKGTGNYNLLGLRELSQLVAREIGRDISSFRPIIGGDLFSCETGIHLQGLLADPATYEPFDPGLVGAKRSLLIGSKAGKHSVAAVLDRLGLPRPDAEILTRLTCQVRALASEQRSFLADQEIELLFTNF